MTFIKHSDGKILNIVDSDNLTEEQKIAISKASEELVKQSKDSIDSSVKKKLGN